MNFKNTNLVKENHSRYYIIQTPKNSSVRIAKDPLTGLFCYRRPCPQLYPAHYGFIQSYDSDMIVVKNEKEDEHDFFLMSNVSLTTGHAIMEKDLIEVGTLVCYDYRSEKKDDKLLVVLKDEYDAMVFNTWTGYIDSVVSFLSCLRGSFRVIDFKIKNLPSKVKELYASCDWTSLSLWPKNFDNSKEETFYKHKT